MKKLLIQIVVFVILAAGGSTAYGIDHIVTVAKKGGDYNSIKKALSSIRDNSERNRYVISIGPGVFSVTEQINMKPYVSIKGSGKESTQLISRIKEVGSYRSMFYGGGFDVYSTVISNLSVDMYVNQTYQNSVVLACDKGCPRLKNVDFTVRSNLASARLVGVSLSASRSVYIDDSSVKVLSSNEYSTGIFLDATGVFLSNAKVQAKVGIHAIAGGIIRATGSNMSGQPSFLLDDSDGVILDSFLTNVLIRYGTSENAFRVIRSTVGSIVNEVVGGGPVLIIHSIFLDGATVSGAHFVCKFTTTAEGGEYSDNCSLPG